MAFIMANSSALRMPSSREIFEDGFEFFFGEGFAHGAEEVGEAAADQVQRVAQGRQHAANRPQDWAIEAGEGGGVEQADVFWADFAEENQEDGHGGDGD